MNKSITPGEYRAETLAISRVENEPLDKAQAALALYGLGLCGEAGEVTDEIKKVLFHGKPLDSDHLLKEVGDVLWYADRILMAIGHTMKDAMVRNLTNLQARYPDGWDAAEQHHGWTGAES